MISRIRGIVHSCDGLAVHLAIPGTGITREVLTCAHRAAVLQNAVGKEIEFITIEYLESHGQGSSFIPRIVGFAAPSEKRLFELLTTVKGIGNRKALRAMACECEDIVRWIATRDVAGLTSLPEIGKKLAETIIAELASKCAGMTGATVELSARGGGAVIGGGAVEQAVAALIALGDARVEAEGRVRLALSREPTLDSTEQIIAAALAGA